MEIEILIEEPAWDGLDLQSLVPRAAAGVLRELGLSPAAHSLSVLACNDARIARLNGDFRAKPDPTNILSWPSEDRAPITPGHAPALDNVPAELGDLALAYETCAREAVENGKTLHDHVSHLVVHGVLHCLGYDHETDADAALMERMEVCVLARLGVSDPY